MDTKIQKYARRCELAAWALMALAVIQWLTKWIADWFTYALASFSNLDLAKYKTFAEAFEKLPKDQSSQLAFVDMTLQADIGNSWIGLINLEKLSWTSRLLGFLCDGVGIGIMLIGFWFFIKLMAQLKKRQLFSSEVIELLNKIAKVIFCFALYAPINRMLLSLLVALQNPPGQRFFVATFNFNDLFTLAVSWFFVILTSLMYESRQLQSEHDLTV